MIRAHDLGQDVCILDIASQALGHDKIVYAPADIPLPCGGTVAPPRVCVGTVGVQAAEGIDKSGIQKLRELFSLLVGEPGIEVICRRIFKINLLMGNIHVAADYDGL